MSASLRSRAVTSVVALVTLCFCPSMKDAAAQRVSFPTYARDLPPGTPVTVVPHLVQTYDGLQPFGGGATLDGTIAPGMTGPPAFTVPPPISAPALGPVAPYPGLGPTDPPGFDPYNCTTCPPANIAVAAPKSGGLVGGFEAAFLEPYAPLLQQANFNSVVDTTAASPMLSFPGFSSFTYSPRIWAGYKFSQGLGVKFEYWNFSSGANATTTGAIFNGGSFGDQILATFPGYDTITSDLRLQQRVKVTTYDFELMQDGIFHNWEFQVAGGARYAEAMFRNQVSTNMATITDTVFPFNPVIAGQGPFTQQSDSRFRGVGPTISLFARRPFGSWDGFALIGDTRMSFLFGDTRARNQFINGNVAPAAITNLPGGTNNDIVPLWELRVGGEWSRILNNGMRLHIGALFEGQFWDWNPPVFANSSGSGFGFAGPTLTVGIDR